MLDLFKPEALFIIINVLLHIATHNEGEEVANDL